MTYIRDACILQGSFLNHIYQIVIRSRSSSGLVSKQGNPTPSDKKEEQSRPALSLLASAVASSALTHHQAASNRQRLSSVLIRAPVSAQHLQQSIKENQSATPSRCSPITIFYYFSAVCPAASLLQSGRGFYIVSWHAEVIPQMLSHMLFVAHFPFVLNLALSA